MLEFSDFVIFWQIIEVIAIAIVAYILVKISALILNRIIGSETDEKRSALHNVKKFVRIIIWVIAVVYMFAVFGVNLSAILAGLGIGALVVGFAFKDIIENWISGLLIVSSKPYVIGDIIQVDNFKGKVKRIGLRQTVLETFDGNLINIPNALLIREKSINSTAGEKEAISSVVFFIDYIFDVDKAKALIVDALKTTPNVIVDEKKNKGVDFLVKSNKWAIEIQAFFWISIPEKEEFIQSEATQAIKKRFDEANFLPPIPDRLRKDYFLLPMPDNLKKEFLGEKEKENKGD